MWLMRGKPVRAGRVVEEYAAQLDVGETRAAAGSDGRGAGLAHAWHVYENDVVAVGGAGGVRVRTARGFVVIRACR
jgi:hypothetical protein